MLNTFELDRFKHLIKKCAFEMNLHDKTEIEKAEAEKCTYHGCGAASGPSQIGESICTSVAKNMNMEPLGLIAYYLLAYTWNDILDWADSIDN